MPSLIFRFEFSLAEPFTKSTGFFSLLHLCSKKIKNVFAFQRKKFGMLFVETWFALDALEKFIAYDMRVYAGHRHVLKIFAVPFTLMHFDNKRLLVICWDYIYAVRLTSNAINFQLK